MVELSNDTKQNENIQVNARVKVQGSYGTVRYVGKVEGYEGMWVGVEWDDPSRGKHDGVVNGVRYFQTLSPYSGSMVRIEKINQFESLEEAIYDRYYEKEGNPLDEFLIKEAQKFMHAPLLEIVGMEKISKKQSHLGDLTDISVCNCNINEAGNLGQLKSVISLDVSSTLIWNWGIVVDIVRQLPNLKYLNMANNRLALPSEEEIELYKSSFDNLDAINLRNCNYNWSEILHIARLWPNVKSLSLQDNNLKYISKISNQKAAFKYLEKLDLQGNNLEEFENVLNLGNIRTLKELHLAGNKLRHVKLPSCEYNDKLTVFYELMTLNLRDNPIENKFECFNELDKLTSLQNVHFNCNSLTDYEKEASEAIALISNLKTLNKRIISDSDRRNAEIDLWKRFAIKWIGLENNPMEKLEFLKGCRSYMSLVRRFGQPEIEMVCPAIKQSNLIKVKIVDSKSGKILQKKLPSKMSLQALYGLVGKLFSDMDNPVLYGIDYNHENIKIELDNSSKTLDFFSIKDGDTILIE